MDRVTDGVAMTAQVNRWLTIAHSAGPISSLPIRYSPIILTIKYRQYRYFTAALSGLLILREVEKVPNVFAFNMDKIMISTYHSRHPRCGTLSFSNAQVCHFYIMYYVVTSMTSKCQIK